MKRIMFATALAQVVNCGGFHPFEGDDVFKFDVKWNAKKDMVDFEFVIPNGTWMGVIIGGTDMINADII